MLMSCSICYWSPAKMSFDAHAPVHSLLPVRSSSDLHIATLRQNRMRSGRSVWRHEVTAFFFLRTARTEFQSGNGTLQRVVSRRQFNFRFNLQLFGWLLHVGIWKWRTRQQCRRRRWQRRSAAIDRVTLARQSASHVTDHRPCRDASLVRGRHRRQHGVGQNMARPRHATQQLVGNLLGDVIDQWYAVSIPARLARVEIRLVAANRRLSSRVWAVCPRLPRHAVSGADPRSRFHRRTVHRYLLSLSGLSRCVDAAPASIGRWRVTDGGIEKKNETCRVRPVDRIVDPLCTCLYFMTGDFFTTLCDELGRRLNQLLLRRSFWVCVRVCACVFIIDEFSSSL